jgi:hypothetical protein
MLIRNRVVQDLVLESIEVRPSKEGWLRFDQDRVIGAQNRSPFAFSLTPIRLPNRFVKPCRGLQSNVTLPAAAYPVKQSEF